MQHMTPTKPNIVDRVVDYLKTVYQKELDKLNSANTTHAMMQ